MKINALHLRNKEYFYLILKFVSKHLKYKDENIGISGLFYVGIRPDIKFIIRFGIRLDIRPYIRNQTGYLI